MLLENILIIFVKYPQAGFVKTRLAKDIGKEEAVLLYRRFVEIILKRTDDMSFNRFIFYSPARKGRQIQKWLGYGLTTFAQKGNNLGERLSNAVGSTFRKGSKKVVVIGSDSPTIDKKIILKAFKELENKDCVIGPSLDGGYYLLGLSSFNREIFKDISWSTNKVFKQTINKLKKLRLRFNLLEQLSDVDNLKDLLRLMR